MRFGVLRLIRESGRGGQRIIFRKHQIKHPHQKIEMYLPKPGTSQVMHKNWKRTHETFESGFWE